MRRYDYKNCQSLFGYAANVHVRSRGQCQLCGCGGSPIDFHLWRQMTVEHLIGKSQGGYLKQIREAVAERFPELPPEQKEEISQLLDAANTVTACSFCNSTTSRDRSAKSMSDLLQEAKGNTEEVLVYVAGHLRSVLDRKRIDVQRKLEAVKEAFEREVRAKLDMPSS